MALQGERFEHLYKTQTDPDVKERLCLLVVKVEGGDEMIPARMAKELAQE